MKLYQVSRVLVFSDGSVHRTPLKTFPSKEDAAEFQKESQELMAEAVSSLLMRGNAAVGQTAVMDRAEKLISSLGIRQIHTVLGDIDVEEERRIHVPHLVLAKH